MPNLKTHFWTTNHFAKKEFGCICEIKSLCQTSGLLTNKSNASFLRQLPFVVTFCYILTLCYIITLLCKLSNVVTLLHSNILLHHHYVTLEIEQCILAPASLHYLSHYSLYCTFQKQPSHVISEHYLHTLSHPALRPNLKYLLTLFCSNRRWGVGEGMSWQN